MPRGLRISAAVVGGVLGGLAIGVLALVIGLAVAGWWGNRSDANHARAVVQRLVRAPTKVDSCTFVGVGNDEDHYRCRLSAASCTRTFVFGISSYDDTYVTPDTPDAPRHPCRYPSD